MTLTAREVPSGGTGEAKDVSLSPSPPRRHPQRRIR